MENASDIFISWSELLIKIPAHEIIREHLTLENLDDFRIYIIQCCYLYCIDWHSFDVNSDRFHSGVKFKSPYPMRPSVRLLPFPSNKCCVHINWDYSCHPRSQMNMLLSQSVGFSWTESTVLIRLSLRRTAEGYLSKTYSKNDIESSINSISADILKLQRNSFILKCDDTP